MAKTLDQGFDYVNRVWLEFTGHSMENELRLGWTEGVHPEDLPGCLATFRSASQRREPFSMEYRRRHKDGRYRWLVSNGRPRFANDGTFLGYIASCTDINEQRAISARLHSVIETAADGVMIIDGIGTVQTYNAACRRLFGYEPEEVIGRNVKMLMPAPFRDEHDDYLRAYRDTGRRMIIGKGREVAGLRKDGSTFPIRLSVGESSYGGEPAFVGIIHDLSEREAREEALRQVEESLRQHQARLMDFLSVASDWLWETDAEHRFVYITDEPDKTGIASSWVLGKTRWQLAEIEPDQDEHWRTHLADLEARRPFRDFTFSFRAPDGRMLDRAINGRPVLDGQGHFTGYRGTGRKVAQLQPRDAAD